MPWTGTSPNQAYQRSDGTRTGTQVWQEAEADGVDIVSDDHDQHDQDMAEAINAALKKDGGNAATSNLPMGGYRHTNVGEPTALAQYQTLKGAVNGTHRYIAPANVGGTADAITLTTGFSVSAYVAGQQFSFVVENTNTGAATLNVDTLGVKDLTRPNGNDLDAGDLYAGAIALVEYDGTKFQLLNRRIVDGAGGGGDMTGTEIVEAVNVALGSDDWQSVATTEIIPASDIDGRVAVTMTVNGHGGAKFGVCATEDGRLLAWGDVSAFAFNPSGDAYGAYHIPVPWDVDTVSIEAIYAGTSYILVQTDEATGNLYHIGASTHGQGGNSGTSAVTTLTKITKFTTDAVRIASVVTERSSGNTESFWFAITTTGSLYSCGYSGSTHTMGYNSTTNLSTPRKMTESDGTTPLANIVAVSCDTYYAPVWARTSGGKAIRWGAGTDGAHGNNNTTAMAWPDYIETSHGSGTDRTDIAQVAVAGATMGSNRANTWILTSDGKIEVSGSRHYGNGDGASLASSSINTFQPASGAIASLTVSSIHAGGGDYPNCIAITSTGNGYLCGYIASYGLLGNGSTTNLNTFTALSGLPSGFSGALTGAVVCGGNSFTAIVLEATISGAKRLASIGYDVYYATAKNTTGVAAASQTWGLVQGTWGTISAWRVAGTHQEYGLYVLNADGELRYAGANDQGQACMRHAPGVMAKVPVLQRVDIGIPHMLKPPAMRGAYSGSTTYYKNDLATNAGSTWVYISTSPGSGNAPPTLPTESNSYWRLFAKKGDAGYANIVFDFDGGTSALAAGMKCRIPVSFDATILSATLVSDAVGSIVIDVWKDTYANYPPTVADTITASAKPTLSSAQKATDSTLTGWTTAIAAGDILVANVDSVAGITNAVLTLKVQRTT